MNLAAYLPSPNFSTIVGSIGLAGGLILGAQYITAPHTPAATVSIEQTSAQTGDWRTALEAVQADAPQLPQAPSEESVSTLLDAAKSSNLTDTVARSLLVNLSSATSQGLGADIPTQDKIIAAATAAAQPSAPKKTYTRADLLLVNDTPQTQKAYGNDVMAVLGRYTGATSGAVLYAVSKATDNNDKGELLALAKIQKEYEAVVVELARVSVPKTLSPLHVQALNDLGAVAASVADLQKLFEDPLRALASLKQYQILLGETGRVFTSIAESLDKNGILFTKDEPGAAWSVLLSPDSP